MASTQGSERESIAEPELRGLEAGLGKLGTIQRSNEAAIAEFPIGPVAIRLLGEPNFSKTETEYRYGDRGFLIVDCAVNGWSDLATNENGDTHKLVMRKLKLDWAGAQGCSTLYTESVKQHWLTI
jgi:hypothetical protein